MATMTTPPMVVMTGNMTESKSATKMATSSLRKSMKMPTIRDYPAGSIATCIRIWSIGMLDKTISFNDNIRVSIAATVGSAATITMGMAVTDINWALLQR